MIHKGFLMWRKMVLSMILSSNVLSFELLCILYHIFLERKCPSEEGLGCHAACLMRLVYGDYAIVAVEVIDALEGL